jgi:hypothetical protein
MQREDRLFYVRENQKYDAYTATFGSTPGIMGPAIQAEIPGIANTCRSSEGQRSMLFTIGESLFMHPVNMPKFPCSVCLRYRLNRAMQRGLLTNSYSVVITEKAAKKFFGNEKEVVR